MRVSLSIQEDGELRAAVKEMIRGQILSIVREDVKEVLREVCGKKVEGNLKEQMVKQQVRDQVAGVVNRCFSNWDGRGTAREMIQEVVNRTFAGFVTGYAPKTE